jgi:hypothetical protein
MNWRLRMRSFNYDYNNAGAVPALAETRFAGHTIKRVLTSDNQKGG